MKKNIISTFVVTLILFGWQAISWMATPIHNDALKYTTTEDAILSALSSNLSEPGLYSLPGHDMSKEKTQEEREADYKSMLNKPWALVIYNDSFKGMNAGNMIAGLLANLVAAILVVFFLNMGKAEEKSFGGILAMVMTLPFICIFQAVIENMIWWEFPWHFVKGTVMDLIIAWLLAGLYLGRRYRKPATAGQG